MWLQGPLFQTLYTDSSTSGAIDTQSRPGFIGGVNKVVGGVRIGQNRVLPRDCSESSKLVSKFVFTQTEYPMRCYGDSSGGYGFKVFGATAWVHTSVTTTPTRCRYSDATESKISFGSVGSSTSTVFEWAGTGTEDASLDDVRARMMSDVRTGTGRVYVHTHVPACLERQAACVSAASTASGFDFSILPQVPAYRFWCCPAQLEPHGSLGASQGAGRSFLHR